MTVRVYRSTDASAPSLTGTAGSLVSVLDACLVNGYGSQTAAGWTKSFSTTNKAAYRQNATGANNSASPMYLYVDDAVPGTHGGREARVCGFETMSAITPTGTGQFPTSGQSTVGVGTLVVRKSVSADGTVRPWVLIANGQTLYLFVETGDFVSPYPCTLAFWFGDFKSYKASDTYAVMIVGRTAEAQTGLFQEMPSMIGPGGAVTYNMANVMLGHFIARHWTGLGGSVKCGKLWEYNRAVDSNGNGTGANGSWSSDTAAPIAPQMGPGRFSTTVALPYPHGPDQGMLLSPIYLNHGNGIRGYFYGLWGALHDRPLNHGDTITIASGNMNGKSLICQYHLSPFGNVTDAINWMVEYSDTWS
jgi:hypothetical protein